MKILLFVFVLFRGVMGISAQTAKESNLTGTIYDAQGSVVVGCTVTATASRKTFTAKSDGEGVYSLALPVNPYDPKKIEGAAKYDIAVECNGFKRSETKSYRFIPGWLGKMYLDIAMETATLS